MSRGTSFMAALLLCCVCLCVCLIRWGQVCGESDRGGNAFYAPGSMPQFTDKTDAGVPPSTYAACYILLCTLSGFGCSLIYCVHSAAPVRLWLWHTPP